MEWQDFLALLRRSNFNMERQSRLRLFVDEIGSTMCPYIQASQRHGQLITIPICLTADDRENAQYELLANVILLVEAFVRHASALTAPVSRFDLCYCAVFEGECSTLQWKEEIFVPVYSLIEAHYKKEGILLGKFYQGGISYPKVEHELNCPENLLVLRHAISLRDKRFFANKNDFNYRNPIKPQKDGIKFLALQGIDFSSLEHLISKLKAKKMLE